MGLVEIVRDLDEQHSKLKRVRGRGNAVLSHMAVLHYLNGLSIEMDRVNAAIQQAWVLFNNSRDFRHCSRNMDHAQQRMHRVIKHLKKRVK